MEINNKTHEIEEIDVDESKEKDNTQELLSFLKKRLDASKKFTKSNYIDRTKENIKDYEALPPSISDVLSRDPSKSVNSALDSRYSYIVPMIFTNTESAKATMFDRVPDLVIKGRGSDDDRKSEVIDGIYEYLKDKLDLDTFAIEAAHWYILTGFTNAHIGYKVETNKVPVYDPETGEEMIDSETGEVMEQDSKIYDDPIIRVGDPLKNYYSANSKFSVSGDKIPYQFEFERMSIDDIKMTYGEKVSPDSLEGGTDDIDTDELDSSQKMAGVYFYYGDIPEADKHVVEDWSLGAEYYIIMTANKVLHVERKNRRQCKIGKWHGQPNTFFGYGYGTIGAPFQKEKSIRTGQRIRLADVAAYPKYAVKNTPTNKIDPRQLKDPRENVVLLYEDTAPSIIQPGDLSGVVTAAEDRSEADAQSAFGLLDLATGAQNSSTTNTATGQTIFAEASKQKIKLAKRQFMKFYRECIIELFKQCQENWDESRVIMITDEDGNEEAVEVNKEVLAGIDFDNDIDVDAESVSVNKDVMREQMISLYDKVKDDPLIDRKKVFSDMLRKGFDIKNPDRYLKDDVAVQAGTQLQNPQTGEMYTVGESGELISPEQQAEMGAPEGSQAMPQAPTATAPTQAGLSGGVAGSVY